MRNASRLLMLCAIDIVKSNDLYSNWLCFMTIRTIFFIDRWIIIGDKYMKLADIYMSIMSNLSTTTTTKTLLVSHVHLVLLGIFRIYERID